ncbi:hypothetical protein D3C81_2147740 [compost metagenome]
MPKGLCRWISQAWRSDTEATIPAPINNIAMIINAISQCSSRASGAKWFGYALIVQAPVWRWATG